MKRLVLLAGLLLMMTPSARARTPGSHGYIPLLPPRDVSYASYLEPAPSIREKKASPTPWVVGFEAGAIAQGKSNSSKITEFNLLWGFRLFPVFPVARKLFLKPSLGLFADREGVAKTSVVQFLGEVGASLQWLVAKQRRLNVLVGGAARAEFNASLTSVAAVAGSSASGDSKLSPILVRCRTGPSVGFTYSFKDNFGVLADLEAAVSITRPVHPYLGLVTGLVFSFY